MENRTLPVPSFYDASKVGTIYQVPYQERATQAKDWARQHNILPAASDSPKVALMAIDCQNTFCIPTGELFVGGRSGNGSVEDNNRLAQYIYRNLPNITSFTLTQDTHRNMAIFHPIFWVNDVGDNPGPATMISAAQVRNGEWKVNPAAAGVFGGNYMLLQRYALDYVETLEANNRYALTIWPYHALLGGIGHAIVSAVEEAVFFHSIARNTMPYFQSKGGNPLTENYSILGPEVRNMTNHAQKNTDLINNLLTYDILIIAGQAKSHCVAWTIDDLLTEIQAKDASLVKKVYLLEDGTSAVVIPGIIDFTDMANEAFEKFRNAGMNITTTQTPIYELLP